jgi:hypothetical protein
MAQGLIFWAATASVGMGLGVLFVVLVALKQLTADVDPDWGRVVVHCRRPLRIEINRD